MTYRPHIAFEGPATACVITDSNGVKHILGWTNCTPASFCMAIERSTLGRIRLTACSVRDKTGDVSGGTTLDQNAYVSQQLYGIPTDVHNGNNVALPAWTARQVQAGRPLVVQGNAGALVGTVHRSTQGRVNHAVYVNEVRGGTLGSPAEALVYDPAADGRVAGWGTAARGPQWWPWVLVLKFAAELQPWGDDDPRKLGAGKLYVAVFPDTDGAIWGRDVSAANRAVDPDGRIAGAAVRKAGHNYGTLVDTSDLKAALTKVGHNYGSVVDPSDVQWLINWAKA
jgi:hypothetical protein